MTITVTQDVTTLNLTVSQDNNVVTIQPTINSGSSSGGGGTWGTITGTLSDQTDLQAALDGKQDTLVSAELVAFNSVIQLDKNYVSTNTNRYTQVGQIDFTADLTGAVINNSWHQEIYSNGDDWTFSSDFGSVATSVFKISNILQPEVGKSYRLIFFYSGSKIDVSITEIEDLTAIASSQLLAPVLSNADNTVVGQITVDITDNNTSPNEEETLMEYKETASGTWLEHGTATQDATSYIFNSLSELTSYDFRATAIGNGVTTSDSVVSSTLTASTIENPLTELNAPALSNADTVVSGQVTVDITDNNTSPNEVETSMQYKETASGTWLTHGVAVQDATSYVYNSLSGSTQYDFRAIAVGDAVTTDNSLPSNTLTATTTGSSIIVMQDDFNDNSIDVAKWTDNRASEAFFEQNNRMEILLPHDTIVGNTDTSLVSVAEISSGDAWFQFDIEAENAVASNKLVLIGLKEANASSPSNSARLISDNGGNAGKLRFQVFIAGSKVYELADLEGITTYRIGYNIATNAITLDELTAPDTWTNVVSHTADISNGSGVIDAFMSIVDATSPSKVDTTYIDNVYLSNGNYSTSVPV